MVTSYHSASLRSVKGIALVFWTVRSLQKKPHSFDLHRILQHRHPTKPHSTNTVRSTSPRHRNKLNNLVRLRSYSCPNSPFRLDSFDTNNHAIHNLHHIGGIDYLFARIFMLLI
ncbi:hypothetical protein VTL71DRAFT_12138 [Oculimacula yallundae]|uniref:Uncharacterized protein n=1 Tax=Oculimacula yallundae TaxID=86028 RepID=A0ABR4CS57_9HELO